MTSAGALQIMVNTLGWTLVHFLWQGLVLWGLFGLSMLLLRPAAAAVRYWVGMVTLAAMGIAPILTFAALFDASGTIATAATTGALGRVAVTGDGWASTLGQIESVLPLAVAAWLLGVALHAGRIALDCLRIRRLALRDLTPLAPEWQRITASLRASLGVHQAVRIMTSARVAVPMVVGWFRPLILIPPSAMLGLTPRQLELIISHELAHVKRFDYFFNLLQIVIETILFYHPAVRAISTRVREEREHCCDDVVVHHSGDRLAYARALTEVAGLRCSAGMQVAVAATGGQLMGRVQRLVAMPGPQRGAAYWTTGLIIAAILAAGSMQQMPRLDDTVAVGWPGLADIPAATTPMVRPPVAAPLSVAETAAPGPEPISRPGSLLEAIPEPAAIHMPETPSSVSPAPLPVHPAGSRTPAAPRGSPEPLTAEIVPLVAVTPSVAPEVVEPVAPAPPSDPVTKSVRPPTVIAPVASMSSPPAAPLDASTPTAPQQELAAPQQPALLDAVGIQVSPPQDPPAPARIIEVVPSSDAAPAGQLPAERSTAPSLPAAPEPVMTGGALLKSVPPSYPRRAQVKDIEGSVRVRYVVDKNGRVRDIQILSSRQGRYFERPVRKALKRWRYEPFAVDGVPVRQTIERSFDFGLAGEETLLLADVGVCQKVTGTRICRSPRGYEDMAVTVVGSAP